MLLNTVSEKLISTSDDENATLNLVHDSLEARMALLKTIVVSCTYILNFFIRTTSLCRSRITEELLR
jgi:hypothetical protein